MNLYMKYVKRSEIDTFSKFLDDLMEKPLNKQIGSMLKKAYCECIVS